MAVTFVQGKALLGNSIQISGTNTVAFASNVTAGNTLIFCLYQWYFGFTPTITDSQGNTWTKVVGRNDGHGSANSGGVFVFTAVAASSAACTLTVSAGGGTNTDGGFLVEVSGLTSSPFDQCSTPVESISSPVSAGSITPSVNGSYILAYFSRAGLPSTYTAVSPFTMESITSDTSNAIMDYVQPTAGAITPTATATVNSSYKIWGMAVSFKPAASAPTLTISVSDTTTIKEFNQMGSSIIFDNSANFSSVLTSISGSYTTAGTNRGLVAIVYSASTLFDLQNPTYGGVVMGDAQIIQLPSGYPGYLAAYYMTNPASGSNTFAVTRTGTGTTLAAVVSSYYNVEQDNGYDESANATALLAASITASVLTNYRNDWTILGVVSGLGATITAGSGSFSRNNVSPLWLLDSNGSVGSAGTVSMTANSSSSVDGLAAVILSLNQYIWFSTQPSFVEEEDVFITEVVTVTVSSPQVTVSDTTPISENVTIEIISFIQKSDTTNISELVNLELISSVSVSDTSVVSENVNLSLTSYINKNDTTVITDVITSVIISYISVADTTAISENVNIVIILSPPLSLAVSDTNVITENVSIVIVPVLLIQVSDTTVITEQVTVFITVLMLSASDTTAISELVTIQRIIPAPPVVVAILTLYLGWSTSRYSLQTEWQQTAYTLSKNNV